MSAKLNQKDYLKKYLSCEKNQHKKKKQISKKTEKTRVKIIDDDVDVINSDVNDIDELLTGEDAPQIVSIIDDRPPELKTIEDFQGSGKWKSVSKTIPDRIESFSFVYRYNETTSSFANNVNTGNIGSSEGLSSRQRNNYAKVNNDEDLSPTRKKKPISRKRTNAENSLDLKYSTEGIYEQEVGTNGDLDPTRKNDSRQSVRKDLNPKRVKDKQEDLSPKRRKEYQNTDDKSCDHNEDLGTSIRRRDSKNSNSVSLSPKRGGRNNQDCNEDLIPRLQREHIKSDKEFTPKQKKDHNSTSKEPLKIETWKLSNAQIYSKETARKIALSGKTAGLQDAKSLKQEAEKFRKQQHEMFMQISGRNAEIAVRYSGNNHYKHRKDDLNTRNSDAEEEERRKTKLEKEKQEIYNRWGKGLKQIEDYKNKLADDNHEMSKPLARYSNDAELDEILRRQERAGDPMLNYIRKKEELQKGVKGNELSMPVYTGSFSENRFNIRPGYRWDGVDRSNGYENRWFDVHNKKKAIQEEAYKYSIEDM